jgi:hypothetical protein
VLLSVGGLVLLVYPVCLLANVMSFAAVPDPAVGPVTRIVFKTFLWSSTLYPAVYVVAAAVSLLLSSNERPEAARRVAGVPLVYLVGVLACFLAWVVAG